MNRQTYGQIEYEQIDAKLAIAILHQRNEDGGVADGADDEENAVDGDHHLGAHVQLRGELVDGGGHVVVLEMVLMMVIAAVDHVGVWC